MAPLKYDTLSFVEDSDFSSVADKSVRCKFVVIVLPESVTLVLGPLARFAFHADLVEKFCIARSLGCRRIGKGDTVQLLDPSARVAGGGYLTWTKSPASVRIGGSSKAYGPYDILKLQAVLANSRLFAHGEISIEG